MLIEDGEINHLYYFVSSWNNDIILLFVSVCVFLKGICQ